MDWILQRHHQIDEYSAVALLESVHGDWLVRVRSWGGDTDMPFEDEGSAHEAFDLIVASYVKHRAAAEEVE
jgi:hypothetical protein